jgi:hypothetical protein
MNPTHLVNGINSVCQGGDKSGVGRDWVYTFIQQVNARSGGSGIDLGQQQGPDDDAKGIPLSFPLDGDDTLILPDAKVETDYVSAETDGVFTETYPTSPALDPALD